MWFVLMYSAQEPESALQRCKAGSAAPVHSERAARVLMKTGNCLRCSDREGPQAWSNCLPSSFLIASFTGWTLLFQLWRSTD